METVSADIDSPWRAPSSASREAASWQTEWTATCAGGAYRRGRPTLDRADRQRNIGAPAPLIPRGPEQSVICGRIRPRSRTRRHRFFTSSCCAFEYIDEYLDTDLTLAQLAAAVHLSAYHFCAAVRRPPGCRRTSTSSPAASNGRNSCSAKARSLARGHRCGRRVLRPAQIPRTSRDGGEFDPGLQAAEDWESFRARRRAGRSRSCLATRARATEPGRSAAPRSAAPPSYARPRVRWALARCTSRARPSESPRCGDGSSVAEVPRRPQPPPASPFHGRADPLPPSGPRVDPSRVGRSYPVTPDRVSRRIRDLAQAYKLPSPY